MGDDRLRQLVNPLALQGCRVEIAEQPLNLLDISLLRLVVPAHPVLEEIANRYPGQVKTVKVNIDECPAATSNYEVLNLPTLILFHNGVVVERMDGDQAKSTLKDRVNFYLHEFAR